MFAHNKSGIAYRYRSRRSETAVNMSCCASACLQVGSVDDNKSGGGYAYRASKSALNIVNKSLSIDLAGDGISSVLLHPGKHARTVSLTHCQHSFMAPSSSLL
jgi:NAD(P)-dependent dehydrogenase (short-subunit alcohol dehydrogenase family)